MLRQGLAAQADGLTSTIRQGRSGSPQTSGFGLTKASVDPLQNDRAIGLTFSNFGRVSPESDDAWIPGPLEILTRAGLLHLADSLDDCGCAA